MENIKCRMDGAPGFVKIIFWIIFGVSMALLFSAIFALAVMMLWNWLMPQIFGLASLNYLQALGLLVLARLLVGGWHHGHGRTDRHGFCSPFRDRKDRRSGMRFRDDEEFIEFWENGGCETYRDYLKARESEK